MADHETAVAVVGITDVSIRSVRITYDFLEDMREAPKTVARLHQGDFHCGTESSRFRILKSADGNVQELVIWVNKGLLPRRR